MYQPANFKPDQSDPRKSMGPFVFFKFRWRVLLVWCGSQQRLCSPTCVDLCAGLTLFCCVHVYLHILNARSAAQLSWKRGIAAATSTKAVRKSPLGSSSFHSWDFYCCSCSAVLRTDRIFFPCHLHLCTWHHSCWSRSVSISVGFCSNAFQISWCFKHFFFNLASKHMVYLWSPEIIQIWNTLGFLSHTV